MRTETYTIPERTITETYYEYGELSDDAKEEVKERLLEDRRDWDGDILEEEYLYQLKEIFPNSELKVQYSLNSCQDDGVDIYGNIDLFDLLNHIMDNFTDKQNKFFKWAFSEFYGCYEMRGNNRYTFSINRDYGYTDNILDDLYYTNMRVPAEREADLEKFNEVAGEYLYDLCRKFEDFGYNFFYEMTDDEAKDICDCNEYEFLEDGTLAS